jgi:uncharacterized repeat protein (TIGR03847 family)
VSRPVDFKAPDLFTAGTVGPPGQRVFFLQAREAGVVVTLRTEKEHVGALAEYLAAILAKRPAEPVAGDLALLEPITPAWAVRSLGVGYDEAADRVVVVAEELAEEEEPEEGEETSGEATEEAGAEGATAQFQLSRAQAAAFVERARALVQAGRPTCPVCGQPKNPEGHVCPRANGHGRG